MDWFGDNSYPFAPPACYKEHIFHNPDQKKKDFTVQLPTLCLNDAVKAESFLRKLRNTCVTKIIAPTVWDLFEVLKKAKWKSSEITLQFGMGDLRNALTGSFSREWSVRYSCNLLFIPERGWIALNVPLEDWNKFDSDKLDRLTKFYSTIEGSSIWKDDDDLYNSRLLTNTQNVFGVSFRKPTAEEIINCMGRMLDCMIIGLKSKLDDKGAPYFNGFFLDEPQNTKNDTPPTMIEMQAIHERIQRGIRNHDKLYYSNQHDTFFAIGEYIVPYGVWPWVFDADYYFSTFKDVTDYFYCTSYNAQNPIHRDDDQSVQWKDILDGGYKLRGGFIDIFLDHLKPYKYGSDQRFSESEIPHLVDKALEYGLVEILLFNMTPWEWDKLSSMFPKIDICDAYIQWVNEICKILGEKGWFDEQKGTLMKSYEYCIFYPECWKCDKSNSAIWTPVRPVDFPPIHGQFRYDSDSTSQRKTIYPFIGAITIW